MKKARQRKPRIAPRNPLAVAPLMKKGGAHEKRGKRASRARRKALARRALSDAE